MLLLHSGACSAFASFSCIRVLLMCAELSQNPIQILPEISPSAHLGFLDPALIRYPTLSEAVGSLSEACLKVLVCSALSVRRFSGASHVFGTSSSEARVLLVGRRAVGSDRGPPSFSTRTSPPSFSTRTAPPSFPTLLYVFCYILHTIF